MHAIIRRYDGVDESRTDELTDKVNETLVPKLEKLSGFAGYYLICLLYTSPSPRDRS